MFLADFLGRYGFSVEDLTQHLMTNLDLKPGEALFACGSLVEGFGNGTSDVDLVLISARQREATSATGNIVIMLGQAICDVFVVPPDVMNALLDKLDEFGAPEADMYQCAKGFTDFERRLMHRLYSGVSIFGEEAMSPYRQRVTKRALLFQKFNRSRHEALALQLDLAGLIQQGDWHSVVFCAQTLLDWTIDALLTGFDSTNPVVKWRIRQLAALSQSWYDDVPGLIGEADAAQLYLKWRSGISNGDPKSVHEYVLSVVTMSRQVFLWVEHRLWGGTFANVSGLVRQLKVRHRPVVPLLAPKVAFRSRGDRVEVFELNNHDARFTLPSFGADILPYLDGQTSVQGLADVLSAQTGLPDADRKVMGVVKIVESKGWVADPVIDESRLKALLS